MREGISRRFLFQAPARAPLFRTALRRRADAPRIHVKYVENCVTLVYTDVGITPASNPTSARWRIRAQFGAVSGFSRAASMYQSPLRTAAEDSEVE